MATETKKDPTSCVTPDFRVSYPAVFKSKLNKLSQKMEFSLEALFPKGADLSVVQAAAFAAGAKKWGDDRTKWPAFKNKTFRDQAEKVKDGKLPDGCVAGAFFVRLKSEKRPGVVDINRQEILEESKFYAGCWARAHINAYAYDKGGNTGIALNLNHVQFMRDGDPFSGRPTVESAFSPVEGAGTATDASSLF